MPRVGGYYGPVGVAAGSKRSRDVGLSEELWGWMREELGKHVELPGELSV